MISNERRLDRRAAIRVLLEKRDDLLAGDRARLDQLGRRLGR